MLDVAREQLLCRGRQIPLRKQAFDVLVLLVRNAGELVSKDHLMRSIWGDAVVTENSITQCLKEVRQAINDRKREKIRTVPKRGYAFDLPVTTGETSQGQGLASNTIPLRWVWGLVLALAIGLVTFWAVRHEAPDSGAGISPADPPPANSIAVLPFENMSPDSEMTYVAEGLSEEILNQLAQISDLRVIARTSSFSFKGEDTDIASIGTRLNVAHVLEGSLRVDQDQVRVTAQLVETAGQSHLWSSTYERPLNDIFGLQQEIATSVARELKGVMLADGVEDPSESHIPHPEAYRAVLEGQMRYQRRIEDDLVRARELFQKATQLDPDYALAWARLSAAIYLLYFDGEVSLEEAMAQGAPAASRAIELQPELAEAQFRASWYSVLSGDRDRGREMLLRSFELEPNSPRTLGARAGWAIYQGDAATAVEYQRRAVKIDPLSALERQRLADFSYFAGAFDEFWTQLQVLNRLNPAVAASTCQVQVAIHLHEGRWQEAVSLVEKVPEDIERHTLIAMMASIDGQAERAEQSLHWLESKDSFLSRIRLAEVWSFRGDRERAFDYLDEAQAIISGEFIADPIGTHLLLTRVSHFLSELHDDPRWGDWLDFINGAFS